jgi:hypothetical protein
VPPRTATIIRGNRHPCPQKTPCAHAPKHVIITPGSRETIRPPTQPNPTQDTQIKLQIPQDAARTSATVQGIQIQYPTIFPEDCLNDSADYLQAVGVAPAIAAAILQSVLVVENPRNNVANKIKTDVYGPALVAIGYGQEQEDGTITPDWAAAGSAKENISELADDVKAALAENVNISLAQQIVDNYLTSYIPGHPRRSSGSAEVLDPVEAKARELAKDALAASLAGQAFEWDGQQYSGASIHARAASYKAANEKMLAEKEISLAEWLQDKITETVENRPYFKEQAKRMLAEAAAASDQLDDSGPFGG